MLMDRVNLPWVYYYAVACSGFAFYVGICYVGMDMRIVASRRIRSTTMVYLLIALCFCCSSVVFRYGYIACCLGISYVGEYYINGRLWVFGVMYFPMFARYTSVLRFLVCVDYPIGLFWALYGFRVMLLRVMLIFASCVFLPHPARLSRFLK